MSWLQIAGIVIAAGGAILYHGELSRRFVFVCASLDALEKKNEELQEALEDIQGKYDELDDQLDRLKRPDYYRALEEGDYDALRRMEDGEE